VISYLDENIVEILTPDSQNNRFDVQCLHLDCLDEIIEIATAFKVLHTVVDE
jgi:hypothetical protein